MDAVDLLIRDHRELERLLRAFVDGDATALGQACDLLDVHTMVEEELLHPLLARVDAGLARRAEQHHDEARGIVQRIRAASGDATLARHLGLQLQQAVRHHVADEEHLAFPALRAARGPDVADLTEQVLRRQAQLRRRFSRG